MIPLPHQIPSRRVGGFTLIELLVVIAVIAILASLILSTAGFVQEKGARSRIEVEIAALDTALESYKVDNGDYPEADGGNTSSKELITALMPKNGKVYFEISGKMLNNPTDPWSAANFLVDAFGNPYHYYYDATDPVPDNNPVTQSQNNGPTFFDLWSTGKRTTKPGNLTDEQWRAQWIKNW